jgi:DinB superfamily
MRFDLTEARERLAAAPEILRALVGALPEAWLHGTEGPGTWSPIQVVRHLMWCEIDDWIPRARLIVEQGDRVAFTPFDREGGEARFAGVPIGGLLDEFGRLRAENLRTLDGLGIDAGRLALKGRHPQLGAVTMEQLLATWVAHDFVHYTQITRTLARQYREAVGPWREFMGVMKA